jgi:archaellum component FlaC
MTIDERLERLTERHEALTQSVEMLTRDIDTLRATLSEQEGRWDSRFDRLLRIVESHERRLSGLEGGGDAR